MTTEKVKVKTKTIRSQSIKGVREIKIKMLEDAKKEHAKSEAAKKK